MLDAALAYARMGWKCFPLHTIVNGRCSCARRPDVICSAIPPSPGKHPRIRGGFKAATTDTAQITRWFTRWPDANIGIATGDGLAIVDIDGVEGEQEFKKLVANNEALPQTLVGRTGGGWHIVFAERPGAPELRSAARNHVHIRCAGGYVVAPPSRHISGRTYEWVRKNRIAELPEWLRQFLSGYEITAKKQLDVFAGLGPLPEHLKTKNTKNISSAAAEALKTVWTAAEQARLISALSAIPAIPYETWYQIGMVLQGLGWESSDGTDVGFAIWDQWSQTCPEKYALGACEAKWQSFRRSARGEMTLGTLYHMARAMGWNGRAPEVVRSVPPASAESYPGNQHLNGHANGVKTVPAAFGDQQPIFFPDLNEDRLPKATCTNAGVAITALGITCRKDLFHEKMMVGGHAIHQWAGDLSDEAIQMIRKLIRHRFGFDPKTENTRDACTQLCLEHQYDPVLDYLNGLQWDGRPRIDSWLQRYMNAPDTELNRTIGMLTLVACVRRARAPGTKFDQIVVFESVEGRGKSTAIEILAGKENFSDQHILGLRSQEQQEAMAGIWLYEIADLTGMKKAEIEHVKAFASRKVDRARPAYGRFRIDRDRRTVFFATTNDDEYLKSQTGNRRFWPVVTGKIDLEALRRDRDQLWAEAAKREAEGCSIGLPERLWAAASEEQNQRTENDEWSAAIHNYVNSPDKPHYDVSISDVLSDNQFLRIEAARIGRAEQMRAGAVLRRMGMTRYRKRLAGNAFEWRYRRAD